MMAESQHKSEIHDKDSCAERMNVSRREIEISSVSEYLPQTEVLGYIRYPNVNERKVMWKIDIHVIPTLCVLYLLAFLDRVNIANASLFGMRQDLDLKGNQYNAALLIFFVPYIVFEIPSNALMRRFRPHAWLSGCMFMFGLVSMLQGLTHNYSGIIATRCFLGAFESGMFPGCLYLLTMWYKRSESQRRFTFFFGSTTLAGAFGGLLASAIGKMDGLHGYSGWRWIFILEGALTLVISATMFFFIADFPEEVGWLSAEEKAFVKAKLYADVGDSSRSDVTTWRSVLKVFKDYKIIVGGFMYLGLIVPAYSYTYFSPGIIQDLGNSSIHTQLISVPPWACAFVVSMVIAEISDRCRHRFLFGIGSIALALAGFIILKIEHHNTHLQYAALFLAASGTYTAMPIVLCWFNANVAGHSRRAIATGWQVGFGNIGGFISSYAFLAKDAPEYIAGYSIAIGFHCLAALSCCVYFVGVVLENRKRDRNPAQMGLAHTHIGDLDPEYRYMS